MGIHLANSPMLLIIIIIIAILDSFGLFYSYREKCCYGLVLFHKINLSSKGTSPGSHPTFGGRRVASLKFNYLFQEELALVTSLLRYELFIII